jgi:hypothetical protein
VYVSAPLCALFSNRVGLVELFIVFVPPEGGPRPLVCGLKALVARAALDDDLLGALVEPFDRAKERVSLGLRQMAPEAE